MSGAKPRGSTSGAGPRGSTTAAAAPGRGRLLSNGRYAVLLTVAGTGRSMLGDLALTVWRGDRTEDADGLFFHLYDLERGRRWSPTRQPVAMPRARYRAVAPPGRLALDARLDGIETVVEACVAPHVDVELRRLRIRNRSRAVRRLRVTTAAEVALAPAAAHAAHPAFSKLFVETEHRAGMLLARRRPRSADEHTPRLWHALIGAAPEALETDRLRFLGRGGDAACPLAEVRPGSLSGTVGSVLDPLLALRTTVTLAAGAEAEVTALLGTAATPEEALAARAALAAPGAVAAAFAAAAERETVLLRALALDESTARLLDDLGVALAYDDPALGDPAAVARLAAADAPPPAEPGARGRPLVLVHAVGPQREVVLADALRAERYWRAQGLRVALAVLAAPDSPPPAVDAEVPLAVYDPAALRADGVDVLAAQASLVLSTPLGALPPPPAVTLDPPSRVPARRAPVEAVAGPGRFTRDGREYVLRLPEGMCRPPLPWTNVLANPGFGCLVSESGAGCTWSGNSREHRLTPWTNDPVSDPHGEALYLRDLDTGAFWSPLPGPAPAPGAHEVRHGRGYTSWRHASHALRQRVTTFVARDDPLRVVHLRLTNTARHPRRLAAVLYARLVLGTAPEETARAVVTRRDGASGALLARNVLRNGLVVAAAVAPDGAPATAVSGDRATFLGRFGSPAAPAALTEGRELDGRTGAGLDPCAALELALTVAPGETLECAFLLGAAAGEDEARALLGRHGSPAAVARAFDDAVAGWRDLVEGIEVRTPASELDPLVNGWLLYQTIACRLWGRTAFYQSGGAFGFRDQLQDATALVYTQPARTRAQLLLHAAHQFPAGDVLHWWHPPDDRGIRTRFSDDLVWLPWAALFYGGATGDWDVLDEPVGFVEARALRPGEDEAFLHPARHPATASLYEHCCRALDRSLAAGAHGLPLMGTGDWNDGMNRVGREGRGESVWLGFFLHPVLAGFVPLAERRGDGERAARYRARLRTLRRALDAGSWDGAWYRRAYYDDGTPLGSAAGSECRIDALVQAWAVLSGVAPRARAEAAMDAVLRELVSERDGIVRLLAPPFDRAADDAGEGPGHDPGYIRGYLPGVRENGGQYTHAALWVVRALAGLGRRAEALRLATMLSPLRHAGDVAAVARYRVEPYVVAADVYGVAPHVGRGGWTWYTGSAAWMYRTLLESILGLELRDGRTLVLRPAIPDAWPGYRIRWRLSGEGTRYDVAVVNPGRDAGAVRSVHVDGAAGVVRDGAAHVPLACDGRRHVVRVVLGTRPSG